MFDLFQKKRGNLKDDSLSGLTVALALVPEAIAFSFIAGVNPLVGLWAAVFMGFITSAFGGRPGMISGATGAIAVVAGKAFEFGEAHGGLGAQYIFAVIMVAGVIQIAFGLCKLGRFIRLVPHPVMIGFVNGLAIVIGLGQLGFFKKVTGEDASGAKIMEWIAGNEMGTMIGLILLTMAIIHFFPKLSKSLPSTLVAIVVVGLLSLALPDARSIADILRENTGAGTLSGAFPVPSWPSDVDFGAHWQFILKIGFTIAMVGIIESLMTLQLIDELTETRGKGNRECLAQGAANCLSGLFGGMGGCAMIGQSLINIKSGGRGRTSGIVAALSLAIFILFAGAIIVQIPIAALVGVMFMVVIGTFEWSTFKTFGRVPFSEIIVILAVTLVTVFMHDLALAVFVGVLLSTLRFAWESSRHVYVKVEKDSAEERVYSLEGLLYFGSVREFSDRFKAKTDVNNVVLDLAHARVCDLSAIEALNALGERYRNAGKNLRLRHTSPDCRRMLERAGSLIQIETLPDDPDYTVTRLRAEAAEQLLQNKSD
ncbi:MAG: SulP family inorganic anion transporter [Verrucomicrobiales bacterium]|nr:SulP family inorganic anion transporter [Verrucomicrobiales bacterium]